VYQIEQRQAAPVKPVRITHDEPEVGLRQLPLCLGIAGLHSPRELLLLLRREQGHLGDVPEVEAQKLASERTLEALIRQRATPPVPEDEDSRAGAPGTVR